MNKVKSIKTMMIVYFTLIMATIMIFTGVILYQKFNYTTREYAMQSVNQLTMQVKYNLDTYIRNMMDVSNTLYYKIIKNQNINNNTFMNQMNIIQTTNNNIAHLGIFTNDGQLIASSKYLTITDSKQVLDAPWFQKAIKTPENVHFSSSYTQNIFEGENTQVVSLSRAVSLNKDGDIIQGVLLVDMNLIGIADICDPISNGGMGEVFIVAPNGEVVYGDTKKLGRDLIEELAQKEDGIEVIHDKNRLTTIQIAGYTGWKIVGIWDLKKVSFNFAEVSDFLIFIMVIGILLCILCTLYISSKLSSPLYRLQKSMKLVEGGNFDISVEENEEYIVSELSKTFNKMVERIRELMDEIMKEQDSKRKKEMEVLQSQINPHFLYNTLDSIIWLIEDERLEEATMMITALSRFFRIGISSGRNVITVKEEIEHAKNYLSIQKIRYKNKFEYEIYLDEEVKMAKTVKLILQPLIENALYHGIEYIQHKGMIKVSVYKEGEQLIFKLEDNGIGMNEDLVGRLLNEEFKIQTKGSGVGIRNVHKRIKLYYGETYGVHVKSELEEGTTLSITLPLEYES